MLFLTATSLGICAGMLRSAFSVAFIAFLLVATFVFASLLSAGPTSYLDLLTAILGYNLGLINFVGGLLVLRRMRTA